MGRSETLFNRGARVPASHPRELQRCRVTENSFLLYNSLCFITGVGGGRSNSHAGTSYVSCEPTLCGLRILARSYCEIYNTSFVFLALVTLFRRHRRCSRKVEATATEGNATAVYKRSRMTKSFRLGTRR